MSHFSSRVRASSRSRSFFLESPLPSSQDIQLILQSDHCSQGNLFIANLAAATDILLLSRLSIKTVITCAKGYKHPATTFYIPVGDTPDENIAAQLSQCSMEIGKMLKESNVLVHCVAGHNRSTIFTAAYLIVSRHLSVEEAISEIKRKRKMAQVGMEFMESLHNYYRQTQQKQQIIVTGEKAISISSKSRNATVPLKISTQQSCQAMTAWDSLVPEIQTQLPFEHSIYSKGKSVQLSRHCQSEIVTPSRRGTPHTPCSGYGLFKSVIKTKRSKQQEMIEQQREQFEISMEHIDRRNKELNTRLMNIRSRQ